MRFPRHMTLELTAKCNFRCPYCYCLWHEFPQIGKPELDTAGWKAILDTCASDGVEDILFTGGETLMHPDLFPILSYARRRLPRAALSLFTNASLLDESLIKRFKRQRIRLATSLQGLATYGAMTGTRRTFRRLLALVARAGELHWPISVSMTITKANLHESQPARGDRHVCRRSPFRRRIDPCGADDGRRTRPRPPGTDALARRVERDKGRNPRPSRLRRPVHVLRRVLLRMPQRPARSATAPEMARPQP